MIKVWKLNQDTVAVVVIDEFEVAELREPDFEDRCLTGHESQFHLPINDLHKEAQLLRLSRRDIAALRQAPPGSALMISIPDEFPTYSRKNERQHLRRRRDRSTWEVPRQ